MIYDCTSLTCFPMYRRFVKAAKHIACTERGTMVHTDFFNKILLKYYHTFCFIMLGGDNDVSRVKNGRWKKVFETLIWNMQYLLQRIASEGVATVYIARTNFFIYSSLQSWVWFFVTSSCYSSCHQRFMPVKLFITEISENISQKFHEQ